MNYNLDLHGGRLRRPISLPDPPHPRRGGSGMERCGDACVAWLEDQAAPASWENPTTNFS